MGQYNFSHNVWVAGSKLKWYIFCVSLFSLLKFGSHNGLKNLCVDWMERKRRLFEKRGFSPCIHPYHIEVWWYKEMVNASLMLNSTILSIYMTSWRLSWFSQHRPCPAPNRHSSNYVLQLYLPSTSWRDRTILERLVWILLVFT